MFSNTSEEKKEKRKCVNIQTRKTIAKMYHYLKNDAKEIMEIVNDPLLWPRIRIAARLGEHVNNVRKRTAEAAGVSESTISKILAEERSPGSFKTPYADRKKRPTKLEMSTLTENIIRTTIENYQAEHQKLPSLSKLKRLFNEQHNFTGSISTLHKILVDLGFKWRRTAKKQTNPSDFLQVELGLQSYNPEVSIAENDTGV